MRKLFAFLIVVGVSVSLHAQTQTFNSNPEKGFIHINLPKTPESQGFERYGNTAVNELTGTPEISIPLYNLQSKFLNTPVSLSYNAGGIKVNQEASSTGLGFDLLAGGRVTVDVKGSPDGVSSSLMSSSQTKLGIQKMLNRLGQSNAKPVLTFTASPYEFCDTETVHYDDDYVLKSMAWYGAGEPDVYHANFGGQSVSFYFDMVTDSIKFIGEKSFCRITAVRNTNNVLINRWVITDAKGIDYHFVVTEESKFSQPTGYGIFSTDNGTTAWVLTKIIHPDADSIIFTYNKYGETYPAFNWSASIGARTNDASYSILSNDLEQNQFTLYPATLTKIETSNTSIDFVLSSRNDLRGPAAKKIDEIRVTDKGTGALKKKVQFRYSYFDGSPSAYTNTIADSLKPYAKLRLRLDSLFVSDSATGIPPYRFHYFDAGVDKYSFSQDHWGYYNATNNTLGGVFPSTSPKCLIPKQADLIAEHILPPAVVSGVTPPTDGTALSRSCNALGSRMFTLDTITYPTGGKTSLVMEPHQSNYLSPSYTITGGGLRVKRIIDINPDGIPAQIVDYSYAGGVYQGVISYLTMPLSIQGFPMSQTPSQIFPLMNYMGAFGAMSDNNFLVGYSQVTKTYRNGFNQSIAGSVVKSYSVPQSYEVAMSASVEKRPAEWPISVYDSSTNQVVNYNNSDLIHYLHPYFYGLSPGIRGQLDGKLLKEEYFDNSNLLQKSIDYYYSQRDYSQKFYSIRAKDNWEGGMGTTHDECGVSIDPIQHDYMVLGGVRRFSIVALPAKSYYTLPDSIIEKNYLPTTTVIQKKTYKYNQYFQPEFETVYNSDGTQTITRTLTSLALGKTLAGIPSTTETAEMVSLASLNICDYPVEQTKIKRAANGDSIVLASTINLFRKSLPTKSFVLEQSSPLIFRSGFIPLYLSMPNAQQYTQLVMDSRYALKDSADYHSSNLMKNLYTRAGTNTYLWDDAGNDLLSQTINARNTDVAYTSFEASGYGNWTLSPAAISTDATAPTGKKAYSLSGGSISKTGLSSTKTYTVSYWSKSGPQTVNGTTAVLLRSVNGWTCYEHNVANPASGTITVSGTGIIDELRLSPSDAMMNSYTYSPVYGLLNAADVNNRVSLYDYDMAGRLLRIRDDNRNILKQFQYKYGLVINFPYGNVKKTSTATKSGCAYGYIGNVTYPYKVEANRYGSFLSQADADAKAQADVDQNGQAWADLTGTCVPYYSFVPGSGWNIPSYSFALSGTGSVNFSIVIYGDYGSINTQLGTLAGPLFLPSVTRYVPVTSMGNTYIVVFYSNGQVNIMGPGFSGSIQLNGSYTL